MLAFLLVLMLWSSVVFAETPQYHDVIMQNAAVATGDGRMLNVHNASVVQLDVNITGVATVDFLIAGPGNFGPYPKLCTPSDSSIGATQTTTTGVYKCLVAAGNVLVARVSAWTSGTVTVIGRASTAF